MPIKFVEKAAQNPPFAPTNPLPQMESIISPTTPLIDKEGRFMLEMDQAFPADLFTPEGRKFNIEQERRLREEQDIIRLLQDGALLL